ncbi:MAG: hypothetical protein L3K26_07270 [Candidatus Hydrogenedentes bacterium]|nr:hypothetical protein [Candidatus Hydrogenedentota bacterium]
MPDVLTGEILFDSVAIMVAGIICLYVHQKFYLDARVMELRFKAFALRDRLSMLAVKGVLSEETREYLFLQEKINVLIYGCEHLSMRILVRAIKDTRSEESKASYEELSKDIRKRPEVLEIYVETLECLLAAFYINSLIIRTMLFLSTLLGVRRGTEVKDSVAHLQSRISQSRQDWPGLVPI